MVSPEELCSQYKVRPLTDAQHPSLGPAEESHFRQEEEGNRDGVFLAATEMDLLLRWRADAEVQQRGPEEI